MKLTHASFVALAAFGRLARSAQATDRNWTGATSMYWSDAGNWNPSGPPRNGDNLFFDATGTNKAMNNDLANFIAGELFFRATARRMN